MFGQRNDQDNSNTTAAPAAAAALGPQEPATITPTGAPQSGTDDYVMTDLPHLPAPDQVTPVAAPTGTPMVIDPAAAPTTTSGNVPSDLIELKQSALQELSPLVGHLEQTPEEKFRTTMMMIQASDDQAMLPAAFQSAKEIKDEKARAQALLDVINEINYFTQQHADA
jgi:hypothetical protein